MLVSFCCVAHRRTRHLCRRWRAALVWRCAFSVKLVIGNMPARKRRGEEVRLLRGTHARHHGHNTRAGRCAPRGRRGCGLSPPGTGGGRGSSVLARGARAGRRQRRQGDAEPAFLGKTRAGRDEGKPHRRSGALLPLPLHALPARTGSANGHFTVKNARRDFKPPLKCELEVVRDTPRAEWAECEHHFRQPGLL